MLGQVHSPHAAFAEHAKNVVSLGDDLAHEILGALPCPERGPVTGAEPELGVPRLPALRADLRFGARRAADRRGAEIGPAERAGAQGYRRRIRLLPWLRRAAGRGAVCQHRSHHSGRGDGQIVRSPAPFSLVTGLSLEAERHEVPGVRLAGEEYETSAGCPGHVADHLVPGRRAPDRLQQSFPFGLRRGRHVGAGDVRSAVGTRRLPSAEWGVAKGTGAGRRRHRGVELLDDLEHRRVGPGGCPDDLPLEHDQMSGGHRASQEGVFALPILAEGSQDLEAARTESADDVQRPGKLGVGLGRAFGRGATGGHETPSKERGSFRLVASPPLYQTHPREERSGQPLALPAIESNVSLIPIDHISRSRIGMMRRLVPGTMLLFLAAAPLHGQTLRDNIRDLFVFGSCGEPLCLDVDPAQHGRHFIPAIEDAQGNMLSFLQNSIGVTVSNTPISAATSGAIWSKSDAGLPVRTATSAGPLFAERAQTLGKGHFLMGVGVSGFNFTTIRTTPLNGLVFDFTHSDSDNDGELGDQEFENDILQVRTNLDVKLFAATAVLTYGLLDRVDLGVAVPLVHISVDGASAAQIIPAEENTPHNLGTPANPSLTSSTATSGSATGIGDVAARVKVQVAQGERNGFGIVGEVRFPTGKEEDLLGLGEYSARGVGIFSGRYGNFGPHANVGYLYRGGDSQNSSFLATLGFDQLLGGWATFAADVISEWQVGTAKLTQPAPVVLNTPLGGGTSARLIPRSNIQDRKDDVIQGSFGFKFTAPSGITVITNALIPIRRGYLQPDIAWTAGLEYSF